MSVHGVLVVDERLCKTDGFPASILSTRGNGWSPPVTRLNSYWLSSACSVATPTTPTTSPLNSYRSQLRLIFPPTPFDRQNARIALVGCSVPAFSEPRRGHIPYLLWSPCPVQPSFQRTQSYESRRGLLHKPFHARHNKTCTLHLVVHLSCLAHYQSASPTPHCAVSLSEQSMFLLETDPF